MSSERHLPLSGQNTSFTNLQSEDEADKNDNAEGGGGEGVTLKVARQLRPHSAAYAVDDNPGDKGGAPGRRSLDAPLNGGSVVTRAIMVQTIANTNKLMVNFEDKDEGKQKKKIRKGGTKEDDGKELPDELICSGAWNDDPAEMLSRDYLKGLNQRLFLGGSRNVNEHKQLVRELQFLRKQRQTHLRKCDHILSQQRQKIMKGKEDFQNMINAGSSKSKKKPKPKKLSLSLPRLFHPDYTHRKTQVPVPELAAMARTPRLHRSNSSMASAVSLSLTSLPQRQLGRVIALTVREIPAKLFRLGLVDEKESAAAELLLEIRDAVEKLNSRGSQGSKQSYASAMSVNTELQEMIKANRRKEIVESILEQTARQKEALGAFSRENLRKVDDSGPSHEDGLCQTKKTLEFQSKMLQTHPFVAQAILLRGVIPPNLGGLGGRDFGREEKKEKPKPKKNSEDSTDSFDLLQQEETKKGYCTVLGVLRALNLVETKCVNDRISKWCRQMERDKIAKTPKQTKYKKGQDLFPLRGI